MGLVPGLVDGKCEPPVVSRGMGYWRAGTGRVGIKPIQSILVTVVWVGAIRAGWQPALGLYKRMRREIITFWEHYILQGERNNKTGRNLLEEIGEEESERGDPQQTRYLPRTRSSSASGGRNATACGVGVITRRGGDILALDIRRYLEGRGKG